MMLGLPTLITLALSLTSFIPATTASPVDLAKRGGEIVYISYCGPLDDSGLAYFLEADYYTDYTQSQHGEQPISHSQRVDGLGLPANPTYFYFLDSAVTFAAHITNTNPGLYNVAGTGNNGYRDFTCYMDNWRELYRIDNKYCVSQYWCT